MNKVKKNWREKALNLTFAAVGAIPLWALYPLSDFVAFLAGKIVGYRRKVIRENLSSSFPNKNVKELRKIEREFYRFLGDYFVETLRLGRMDKNEIVKRMKFEGTDEVNDALSNGKHVTLYLGHYCNWEWISSIPLHIKDELKGKCLLGQIYHPLENEAADAAFLKIRSRFGATSIKMGDTLKILMKYHRQGMPTIIGYIADQSPLFNAVRYFADFLHHDTPAITGPERMSRMFNSTVFYCDVSRPKRGEYVCRYVKMTDNASLLPPFELTRKYYELLQNSILRQPPFWLWSHRRWKRNRQDFYDYFGEEEAIKRLAHP